MGDFRVFHELGNGSACSVLANLQCFSPDCLMKTIAAFIVGLLIATVAWAQIDKANGIVWLPNSMGTLMETQRLSNGPAPRWRRGVALDSVTTENV